MIIQKKDIVVYGSEKKIGEHIWFYCPGCEELHQIYIKHNSSSAPIWKWNGSLDKPTFSPSIVISPNNKEYRCHSFVREGRIQFLSDCFHKLKNQIVDLPELPDWFWGYEERDKDKEK